MSHEPFSTALATEFDFFALIRYLKRFVISPHQDLHFGANPDLAFPEGEVASLSPDLDTSSAVQVGVNFLQLIGQSGILPLSDLEIILKRIALKDKTLLDFLDIFHHRLISLFYEIGLLGRYYLSYEMDKPHPLINLLYGFSGQSEKQTADFFLYHAGLTNPQTRSLDNLAMILTRCFAVPITCIPFTPEWIPLKKGEMILGKTRLGECLWHIQNQFTLRIGPLTYPELTHFLPDGDRLPLLKEMVLSYVGLEYVACIEILVKNSTLPLSSLQDPPPLKLGWGLGLGDPAAESAVSLYRI